MDVFPLEFDSFRRRVEPHMKLSGSSPEAFASILCTQNAALPRQGKSLVLASAKGGLGFPDVAKQIGRLSRPLRGAAHQDVLEGQGCGYIIG